MRVLRLKNYNKQSEIDANGMIVSKHCSISLTDTSNNKNILVLGGAGTGKGFCFAKPNIKNGATSMIVLDPGGDYYKECGEALSEKGFEVYHIIGREKISCDCFLNRDLEHFHTTPKQALFIEMDICSTVGYPQLVAFLEEVLAWRYKEQEDTLHLPHLQVYLDEAQAVILPLEQWLATARLTQTGFSLLYQSLEQIRMQYKNMDALLRNIDHILYFGVTDDTTLQFLLQWLDGASVLEQKKYRLKKRPAITIEELTFFPAEKALVMEKDTVLLDDKWE